jgi:hypothetical protein
MLDTSPLMNSPMIWSVGSIIKCLMPFLENLAYWLFSILRFHFVRYALKPVVMATQMSGLLGFVNTPIDMVFQTHTRESNSPLTQRAPDGWESPRFQAVCVA